MRKKHATRLEEAGAGRARQGERRVVTILICDVAGSTAMAEHVADPGLRASFLALPAVRRALEA